MKGGKSNARILCAGGNSLEQLRGGLPSRRVGLSGCAVIGDGQTTGTDRSDPVRLSCIASGFLLEGFPLNKFCF